MVTIGDDRRYPIVTLKPVAGYRVFGVGDDGDDHFLYIRGKILRLFLLWPLKTAKPPRRRLSRR